MKWRRFFSLSLTRLLPATSMAHWPTVPEHGCGVLVWWAGPDGDLRTGWIKDVGWAIDTVPLWAVKVLRWQRLVGLFAKPLGEIHYAVLEVPGDRQYQVPASEVIAVRVPLPVQATA